MSFPLYLKKFQLQGKTIELFVPDPSLVQQRFRQGDIPFPYWSQVWPSALALGDFLLRNINLIKNKRIVELAAGLGLPSMIAAKYASHVLCSDYHAEPVAIMQQSALHNGLNNLHAKILNWQSLPGDLQADVVLLSDINYEPKEFEQQYHLINSFLQKNTLIILSTPQRLAGKKFIEQLLPLCKHQEEIIGFSEENEVVINVFVLRN
jgi:predicted nicotinamide N-methyase